MGQQYPDCAVAREMPETTVEHMGQRHPARVVTRLGGNSYISILNWAGGSGKLRFTLDGVKSWWAESTRGAAKVRAMGREDVYQYVAAVSKKGRMTISILDNLRETVFMDTDYEVTLILSPFSDDGAGRTETVDTDKYFPGGSRKPPPLPPVPPTGPTGSTAPLLSKPPVVSKVVEGKHACR